MKEIVMKTWFSKKSVVRAGAMIVTALSLTACATMDSGTPEQIVTKRAQAYWDARLKGDASAAYGFANDAFRQAVDEEKFKRGHMATFAVGAEVQKVECDAQKCDVGVNLKVNPPLPGKKIGTIDMYSKQTWLLEDGQWKLYLEP